MKVEVSQLVDQRDHRPHVLEELRVFLDFGHYKLKFFSNKIIVDFGPSNNELLPSRFYHTFPKNYQFVLFAVKFGFLFF